MSTTKQLNDILSKLETAKQNIGKGGVLTGGGVTGGRSTGGKKGKKAMESCPTCGGVLMPNVTGGMEPKPKPKAKSHKAGVLLPNVIGGMEDFNGQQLGGMEDFNGQQLGGADFAGQGGRIARGSKQVPNWLNPWREHLAKVRNQNPGLSLKQAMQKASASYKK